MGITIEQYRAVIGTFVRIKMIKITRTSLNWSMSSHIFLNIMFYIITIMIINMKSNDIEMNPGPNNYCDLNVCHLNIQSMKRNREKLTQIQVQLASNYDIVTVSETWLSADDPDDSYSLKGFQPIFRRDRLIRRGGGVAAWVSNRLVAQRLPELENPNIESLWLKIRSQNSIFLTCVIYRPPSHES